MTDARKRVLKRVPAKGVRRPSRGRVRGREAEAVQEQAPEERVEVEEEVEAGLGLQADPGEKDLADPVPEERRASVLDQIAMVRCDYSRFWFAPDARTGLNRSRSRGAFRNRASGYCAEKC